MRRCGRKPERGSETLEFFGVVPLVVIVALFMWQGVILVRQQAEADADARTLARQAVVCDAGKPLTLYDIDKAAAGEVTTSAGHDAYITVTVALHPQAAVSEVDLSRFGFPSPRAAVTMRHEPC